MMFMTAIQNAWNSVVTTTKQAFCKHINHVNPDGQQWVAQKDPTGKTVFKLMDRHTCKICKKDEFKEI